MNKQACNLLSEAFGPMTKRVHRVDDIEEASHLPAHTKRAAPSQPPHFTAALSMA